MLTWCIAGALMSGAHGGELSEGDVHIVDVLPSRCGDPVAVLIARLRTAMTKG